MSLIWYIIWCVLININMRKSILKMLLFYPDCISFVFLSKTKWAIKRLIIRTKLKFHRIKNSKLNIHYLSHRAIPKWNQDMEWKVYETKTVASRAWTDTQADKQTETKRQKSKNRGTYDHVLVYTCRYQISSNCDHWRSNKSVILSI